MRTRLGSVPRRLVMSRSARGSLVFALLWLLALVVCWSMTTQWPVAELQPASDLGLQQGGRHIDQAILAPRASVDVPRARVFERLPVLPRGLFLPASVRAPVIVASPACERSQTLRWLQARRRVPRMNTDDPPWS